MNEIYILSSHTMEKSRGADSSEGPRCPVSEGPRCPVSKGERLIIIRENDFMEKCNVNVESQ
jgi:hypothetical protein